MTLTEMRYIVALARERHFGKAAAACHVSQPTLSVALKKVEGQLGAALFERTATDVRITAIGERIVAQAMNHGNLVMSHTSDLPYHVLEATYQQYLRRSTGNGAIAEWCTTTPA